MIYKISLKSSNLFLLNLFTNTIEQLLSLVGLFSVYKIPVRIKKVTVLRSPHVNKKSREQFETRTYTRIIKVITYNNNIMLTLLRAIVFKLPHSIFIKHKSANPFNPALASHSYFD